MQSPALTFSWGIKKLMVLPSPHWSPSQGRLCKGQALGWLSLWIANMTFHASGSLCVHFLDHFPLS